MRTFLLDVAARLDGHIAGLHVEDVVADNSPGQSIETLARSILGRLGWPTP